MARIQFSGQGLVMFPTRSSLATPKSTFEFVNGSISPPTGTKTCFSSTVEVSRGTLGKLSRLGLTCLDRASGDLTAALHDLVSVRANVNAVLHDISLEVADCHLSDTLLLRATPLAFSLLSDVGNIDDRTHTKIVGQLLDIRDERVPEIFCHVAEELTDVASLEVLRLPCPFALAPVPKSSAYRVPRKTTLVFRRRQRVLTIDNLPKIAVLSKKYSDDTPLDYPLDPNTIDSDCNEVKRASIAHWASNIETPRYIHASLHNKYGRLEPDYDCKELIWAEIYIKSKYFRPRLDLEEFSGQSNPALSIAEDFPDVRSEGQYTNMSSNVSVGLLSSCSEKFGSRAPEDSQTSVETTSLEDKVVDSETNHDDHQSGNFPESNSLLGEFTVIGDSSDDVFGANDTTANNSSDPSENTKDPGHHARHLNTLRMTHVGPHPAHGPEQPGFRLFTHSRPAPDWDAPGIKKPEYAQLKKIKKLGALDFFNVPYEAKERRMRKVVMEMREQEKLNDEQPPHRPYTGSGRIFNQPAPKFQLEMPIKHEAGSFTDIWPPRRPLYEAQITNHNNLPPKFAAVLRRPAAAPEYETGTIDVFGHISVSSQGATAMLNTGLPLDSDDVFSCHNDPEYETATMNVVDDVASPDQNTSTSRQAGPLLDSNAFVQYNAFHKSIRQPGYAPRTPRNRIITEEAIIGCEYTPDAECIDEFF